MLRRAQYYLARKVRGRRLHWAHLLHIALRPLVAITDWWRLRQMSETDKDDLVFRLEEGYQYAERMWGVKDPK
jgi:hypothetical protein